MTTLEQSLPIAHVAHCAAARSAVLVADPISYTTRPGTVPASYESDLIVVLTGAVGTYYMVWREAPDIRAAMFPDGTVPATTIYHVAPDQIGGIADEVLHDCGISGRLLDDAGLMNLIRSWAPDGARDATLAQVQRAIVTACRAAIAQAATPGTAPA